MHIEAMRVKASILALTLGVTGYVHCYAMLPITVRTVFHERNKFYFFPLITDTLYRCAAAQRLCLMLFWIGTIADIRVTAT